MVIDIKLYGHKKEILFIKNNCDFKKYTTIRTLFYSDYNLSYTENQFITYCKNLMIQYGRYNALCINYKNNNIDNIKFTEKASNIEYELNTDANPNSNYNVVLFDKDNLLEVKNGWITNGSTLERLENNLFEYPIGIKFKISYDDNSNGVNDNIVGGDIISYIGDESKVISGNLINFNLSNRYNGNNFLLHDVNGTLSVKNIFVDEFVEGNINNYSIFISVTNINASGEEVSVAKKIDFNLTSLIAPDVEPEPEAEPEAEPEPETEPEAEPESEPEQEPEQEPDPVIYQLVDEEAGRIYSSNKHSNWTSDKTSTLSSDMGFSVKNLNLNQTYIILPVPDNIKVYGVATKGKGIQNRWVTKYKVSYNTSTNLQEPSNDSSGWVNVDNGDTFNANVDEDTLVYNFFTTPVPSDAKWIKVSPTDWNNRPGFRVGIYIDLPEQEPEPESEPESETFIQHGYDYTNDLNRKSISQFMNTEGFITLLDDAKAYYGKLGFTKDDNNSDSQNYWFYKENHTINNGTKNGIVITNDNLSNNNFKQKMIDFNFTSQEIADYQLNIDNSSNIDAIAFVLIWNSAKTTITQAQYYTSIQEFNHDDIISNMDTWLKADYELDNNQLRDILSGESRGITSGIIVSKKTDANTDSIPKHAEDANGNPIYPNPTKIDYDVALHDNVVFQDVSVSDSEPEAYQQGLVFAAKNGQYFEDSEIRIQLTAPNGVVHNIDLPRFYMSTGLHNSWDIATGETIFLSEPEAEPEAEPEQEPEAESEA